MILSGIIALTPFPVFWENNADDMFLIGYKQQGFWQIAMSSVDRSVECDSFRLLSFLMLF